VFCKHQLMTESRTEKKEKTIIKIRHVINCFCFNFCSSGMKQTVEEKKNNVVLTQTEVKGFKMSGFYHRIPSKKKKKTLFPWHWEDFVREPVAILYYFLPLLLIIPESPCQLTLSYPRSTPENTRNAVWKTLHFIRNFYH